MPQCFYDFSKNFVWGFLVIDFSQVCEVLKLLNELLPTGDANAEELSEKVYFLVSNPKKLQKFGLDVLPLLVQVVIIIN